MARRLRFALPARLDRAAYALLLGSSLLFAVVVAALALTMAENETADVRGGAVDQAAAELAVFAAFTPPGRRAADGTELRRRARRDLDAALARLGSVGVEHRLTIWNPDGSIVYRTPGEGRLTAPPPDDLTARDRTRSIERAATRGHAAELVTYLPIAVAGRRDVVLELAQPLQPIREDEGDERRGVLVFFAVAAGAAWIGLLPLSLRLARLAAAAWDPRRRRLLRQVRRGILDRELEVHYQPQVALASGEVESVEALVRWRRGGHLIPPGEFLPLVEGSRLIRRLTLFVLDEALRQARAWASDGRPMRVAVNLAPVNLSDPRLVRDVAAVLLEHDFPPARLTLEVTETAVLDDEDAAAATLARLADLGVCLSVDDFGTGHSSLARVTRHPFTELKIDQSFVRELTQQQRPVVAMIVRLAHTLDLRVVAEGVEDEATLNALRALGCDAAQGYLLARPVPAAELADAIRHLPALTESADAVRLLLDSVRESLRLDAAFVSEFVDARQVFRATSGRSESFETRTGDSQPLFASYCGRLAVGVFPNLIEDARGDARTQRLAVTGERDIGAYIGVPLHRPDGSLYGTLCGLGHAPRPDLTDEDVATLAEFGRRLSPFLGSANLAWSAR